MKRVGTDPFLACGSGFKPDAMSRKAIGARFAVRVHCALILVAQHRFPEARTIMDVVRHL